MTELKKIRGKELHFKTYDEFDEYCKGKDVQFCKIKIDEKISDEEYCKRYNALSINIKTNKIINYLPTGKKNPKEEKMEIKTLKDIKYIVLRVEVNKDLEKFYSNIDLKQETIKWIKEDKKFAEGLKEGFVKKGDLPRTFMILISKWMERFNITKEDLK